MKTRPSKTRVWLKDLLALSFILHFLTARQPSFCVHWWNWDAVFFQVVNDFGGTLTWPAVPITFPARHTNFDIVFSYPFTVIFVFLVLKFVSANKTLMSLFVVSHFDNLQERGIICVY